MKTQKPWKLEYDEESGMMFLSVKNKKGQRVGLFQTSGELQPRAGWISELYWNGMGREVKAFAAYIALAVNSHDDLLTALKIALCMSQQNQVPSVPRQDDWEKIIAKAEGK